MLLFLVFCNMPGQRLKSIRYEIGHPFYVMAQFEHGWPFTYLVRADDVEGMYAAAVERAVERAARHCFEVWSEVTDFRPGMLLANVCVMLLASTACGVAFERWRRARTRLWHIHLRDLLVLVLAASLGGAWYFYAWQRHTKLERSIRNDFGDEPVIYTDDQEGGITWLRWLLGGETFQFLDHPFSVYVHQPEGWRRLETFMSAREVHARIRGTTEELAHLEQMPQLEALGLSDDGALPDDIVAELPPLPRLRGLYLTQPVHHCRRIDRLSELEALRITEGCDIDDQALREISALSKLRELALNGLPESADLSFLPSLPRLAALDLYHSEVNGAALESIGQCHRLKVLSLYMCEVDGSGIRQLSGLSKLETLDFDYTNVTSGDLEPLASLKRLQDLKLTGTNVSGDLCFISSLENLETLSLYDTNVTDHDVGQLVGLSCLRSLDLGYTTLGSKGTAYLRQMKQLKWLRVSIMDHAERSALQAALPECQIDFH